MRGRSGRRRRGLVLGAGGFLGAAWTLGALSALQEATDWDLTTADLMVGTSAGAVLAMLLRSGLTVDDLYRDQLRASVGPGGPAAAALDATSGTAGPGAARVSRLPDFALEPSGPTFPRLGVGSWPLLLHAMRNPAQVRPAAWCAALAPRGRRQLTAIGALVDDLHEPDSWPADTYVVATNYWKGSRTVFGRTGGPQAPPSRAVMASCAVPCWYEPVEIGRIPYVDGAVYSPCNADVARDCDEVYVLAPMASLYPDRPTSALGRAERWWRRGATNRTLAEVRRLSASGVRVHVLTPDAEELAVMGANMMDGTRRKDVLRVARAAVARRLAHSDAPTPAGSPRTPTAPAVSLAPMADAA
jgi:NTE family protein